MKNYFYDKVHDAMRLFSIKTRLDPVGQRKFSLNGSSFLFKIYLFIFLAMLGLLCCMWAFSTCGDQGLFSSCNVWASLCCGFSCRKGRDSRQCGLQ